MSYPAPPFGTMPTPKSREFPDVFMWVDDVFAQQGKTATVSDERYWANVLAGEGAWDFGYIYNRMIEGQHAGVDPRTPPPAPTPEPQPEPTPTPVPVVDRTDDILAAVKASEGRIIARIDVFENDAKALLKQLAVSVAVKRFGW